MYMNRAQRGFDDSVVPILDTLDQHDLGAIRQMLISEEEERTPRSKGTHLDRKLYQLSMKPCLDRAESVADNTRNTLWYQSRHPVIFNAGPCSESSKVAANLGDTHATSDGDHGQEKNDAKKEGTDDVFILLSPLFAFSWSPFRQATRSFVVYHLATRRLYHLKDTHRVPTKEYTPEHEILGELYKKGVPRISTVLCARDVVPYGECYDTVFATVFARLSHGKGKPGTGNTASRAQQSLRPCRIIHHNIAQNLETFERFEQLTWVIYDALEGPSIDLVLAM